MRINSVSCVKGSPPFDSPTPVRQASCVIHRITRKTFGA